jgi:hypothetical protein
MAIKPNCTICGDELTEKGAVFIGRPLEVRNPSIAELLEPYNTDLTPKSHLCVDCEDWLSEIVDERRKELQANKELELQGES